MKRNRCGFYTGRLLADGRVLQVWPLTFGRARIIITLDWFGVEDGW